MLRTTAYFKELRNIQVKKMRMFNDMLDILQKRYGNDYPMILTDYVKISLNRAEGLSFSDKQFDSLKSLVNTSQEVVSSSYRNHH